MLKYPGSIENVIFIEEMNEPDNDLWFCFVAHLV